MKVFCQFVLELKDCGEIGVDIEDNFDVCDVREWVYQ